MAEAPFRYRKILSGNLSVDGGPRSPNMGDRGVRTWGTVESDPTSPTFSYFRGLADGGR
jgi:hypothetical protein